MRAILIAWLFGCLFPQPAYPAGRAKHVVVVVWDGMRPDFVRPDYTPNLHQLVREGVFFKNHHPVYLSATEVNGVALATGAYPRRSGVIANREFRPAIDPLKPIGTETLEAIRRGDKLSRGSYLRLPTVAEILRRSGHRTVIAGAKGVALLHDRAERPASSPNVNLFEGRALPPANVAGLTNLLGPFPEVGTAKTNRDWWTTRALTGPLWQEGVPTFSLLWLSEPDYSQHATSPGTRRALAAIRSSDHNLGLVVSTLREKGVLGQTDIFVVSDHGFSTVGGEVDVAAALRRSGFNATREFKKPPARGEVLVVANGGSVLLYVVEHDEPTVERLLRFLQHQSFVGVLFTRRPANGTFKLEDALIDSPDAPDIVFSMRWTEEKNPSGIPGHVILDAETEQILIDRVTLLGDARLGTHVTLSAFDLHNTLIAAGPDFRRGHVDELPTGNVDLAPTILWILGVNPPTPMDGRVLTEALTIDGPPIGTPRITRIDATNRLEQVLWRQYLKRTELNGVVYLDEGNGAATPN